MSLTRELSDSNLVKNGKLYYLHQTGKCGHLTSKMREGKWWLKDSIIKMQVIQFTEQKIVSFRIQEISEEHLILK